MVVAVFYLGTHEPSWLRTAGVPLFVSRGRLARIKRWRPATTRWALDSGGFTELGSHGRWRFSVASYAEEIARAHMEIGMLDWAAPMDSMCEPDVLARTGRSLVAHQHETVERYLELVAQVTEVFIPPVLQGFEPEDYWRCADIYAAAGVDLLSMPLVGVGTVCRRQATPEIGYLIQELASTGLRLHGFGVKLDGLSRYGRLLASADSLAWSLRARMQHRVEGPDPECPHGRGGDGSCSNCIRFALSWREQVVGMMESATSQAALALRPLACSDPAP